MSPPTIAFVPGIAHQGSCFDPLIAKLRSDYECVSRSLPSCFDSADAPKVTLSDDVAFIRNEILKPLIDAGKQVVVVMHSYGGLPGSNAVESLDPGTIKRQGGSGGVIGLVYIAAIVAPKGYNNVTIWEELVPGLSATWVSTSPDVSFCQCLYRMLSTLICVFIKLTHAWCEPDKAREFLYEDLPPQEADHWIQQLRKHAVGASLEPSTYSAWFNAEWKPRCHFIQTLKDRAMPIDMQRKMAPEMKVVAAMPTGHSPFLSIPDEAASVIKDSVKEFEGIGA